MHTVPMLTLKAGPRLRRGQPWVLVALLTTLAFPGCGDPDPPRPDGEDDDTAADAPEAGSCVGTPKPCEAFFDAASCYSQGGCGWDFHGFRCLAARGEGALACELYTIPYRCEGHVGCWWEQGEGGNTRDAAR